MNEPSNSQPVITCIRRDLTLEQANNLGLVLSAAQIAYRAVAYHDRWSLWVDEDDQADAGMALYTYDQENETDADEESFDQEPWGQSTRSWAGVWAALFLGVCHFGVTRSGKADGIIRAYNASAQAILDGEFYRTATALLLHADWGHLLSNMAGIALFGTVVCLRLGYGLGMLTILIAAMAGNGLNALVYQSSHNSIGASTAVFSALGIASIMQAAAKWRQPEKRKWAWLPPASALALLAFLGASLKTDILAHFFGLLTGLVAGALLELMIKKPLENYQQNICVAAAAAVLVGSWITGLQ